MRHSANTSGEAKWLVARVASYYGLSVNTLLRESVYGSEARILRCGLPGKTVASTCERSVRCLAVWTMPRSVRIQKRAETDKQLQRAFEILNV